LKVERRHAWIDTGVRTPVDQDGPQTARAAAAAVPVDARVEHDGDPAAD
jgi:hypothetical protein